MLFLRACCRFLLGEKKLFSPLGLCCAGRQVGVLNWKYARGVFISYVAVVVLVAVLSILVPGFRPYSLWVLLVLGAVEILVMQAKRRRK